MREAGAGGVELNLETGAGAYGEKGDDDDAFDGVGHSGYQQLWLQGQLAKF